MMVSWLGNTGFEFFGFRVGLWAYKEGRVGCGWQTPSHTFVLMA